MDGQSIVITLDTFGDTELPSSPCSAGDDAEDDRPDGGPGRPLLRPPAHPPPHRPRHGHPAPGRRELQDPARHIAPLNRPLTAAEGELLDSKLESKLIH